MSHLMLKLPNRFQKRLAFDIADCAADLDDRNLRFVGRIVAEKAALNLICNMRDDLNCTSAVVAAAFFLKNCPVNLTSRNVRIFIQAFINKTLIMSQVEIRLRSVVRDEHFAVLDRVHRAGIDIDIGVKLLHGNFVASGLQKTAEGRCGNAFSKSGNDAAGDKNVFYCHGLLLVGIKLWILLFE